MLNSNLQVFCDYHVFNVLNSNLQVFCDYHVLNVLNSNLQVFCDYHVFNVLNSNLQVFCDYHGHSRRKNIFIYGCSAAMSWIVNDTNNPGATGNKIEDNGFKVTKWKHVITNF